MASTARAGSRAALPHQIPRLAPRILHWAVSLAWLSFLGFSLVKQGDQVAGNALSLLPWLLVFIVLNLLPMPGWGSTLFTPDVPVAVAAAMVLTPLETGLVCFLGTFDSREYRGQIAVRKALFNRSQIACANFVASLVAHRVADVPTSSALLLPLALVVLAIASSLNHVLVGVALSVETRLSVTQTMRRLRLGTMADYLLALLAWGVLGAMLAALYDRIHPWALLAFLAPTLLGRQALLRSQMFIDTRMAYRSREEALREVTRQIYRERLDERKLIAADLHDEVLQPLFKVTLMAHVLKADLANGRLLEIEEDLPELMTAADLAANTLRELIGDLRQSTLGRGGLPEALRTLVETHSSRTEAKIHARVENVSLTPVSELAIYQIAKEALLNALTHGRAENVWLELSESGGSVHLLVRDDGEGFDPLFQRKGHFGLQIMRERAAAMGASLYIDTTPGLGCEIRLYLMSG